MVVRAERDHEAETQARSAAERDEAAAYRAHRAYVLAVLSRRCRWLDADEREAAFHDAYVVALDKQRRGELDLAAMPAPRLRAYLVQTAIHKALDEGKRAERKRTRAFGDDFPAVADPTPGPYEHAETSWDNARVHELIAELPQRQRTIVKLRYFFERTPAEIQEHMGITSRTYRRQLERAMARVSKRYEVVRAGHFCDERRELISAFVAGTLEPDEARLAREHLMTCPGCASWAVELRLATNKLAAALPLPAFAAADGVFGRGVESIEGIRHGLAETAASVKQHAASLLLRSDPSTGAYLGGARPGAMAATVASCMAIAGGTTTYCVVEGVPEPIRSLVGAEEARGEGEEREPDESSAQATTPAASPGPTPLPDPATTQATVDPQAGQAGAPTQQPAPPPPDPVEQEFGLEGSARSTPQSSSTLEAQATATAPEAQAPAPSAPPGEFDP